MLFTGVMTTVWTQSGEVTQSGKIISELRSDSGHDAGHFNSFFWNPRKREKGEEKTKEDQEGERERRMREEGGKRETGGGRNEGE